MALQQQFLLIRMNEEQILKSGYNQFINEIIYREAFALTLAEVMAQDKNIQEYFAKRQRFELLSYIEPIFIDLKKRHTVEQLHFHIAPATSFLRVHLPSVSGDDLSDHRFTVLSVFKEEIPVSGVEKGKGGVGIRGVVPVFYKGKLTGTMEVGLSFDNLINQIYKDKIYLKAAIYNFDNRALLACKTDTMEVFFPQSDPVRWKTLNDKQPYYTITGKKFAGLLVGIIKNYSGDIIAILELTYDRSPTLASIKQSKITMTVIYVLFLFFSVALIWWISVLLINPLKNIISEAAKIASGELNRKIKIVSNDEIGRLAKSLDTMMDSLTEAHRRRVEQEKMIQEEELKTLGAISARLAHEIRNPLTVVGGFAKRLDNEIRDGDTGKQYTKIIIKEVTRLEAILQMILKYLKPIEMKFITGDINEVLRGIYPDIKKEFALKGRIFKLALASNLPEIFLVPDELARAFTTLLLNASMYMPDGGCCTLSTLSDNESIKINIVYPAPELSDDDLEHFFFPFVYHIGSNGHNINLPFAKIILLRHGGIINIKKNHMKDLEITATIMQDNFWGKNKGSDNG